jgi:acylphosphatase
MENKVCAHAIIAGKVQGVCFRMETKHTAEQFNVNGWVKNKSDGSVEAMFEGEKENVESILRWCKESGPPLSDVIDVAVNWEGFSGKFNEFKITY